MVLSFNLDAPGGSAPTASGGGKGKGSGGSGTAGGGSSSSGSGGSISMHVEAEEIGGSKVTVAALLTELGSQCSSSADAFVQMVKFLCTTQKFVYDEDQISALIVEAVSNWSRPSQPGYGESSMGAGGRFMEAGDGKGGLALSLLQNFMESEPGKDLKFTKEGSSEPWNMEKILSGIRQCNSLLAKKSVDWNKVACFVDRRRLVLYSDDSCELLVDIFKKLSGKAFPSEVLVVPWKNPVAQFNLLAMRQDQTTARWSI